MESTRAIEVNGTLLSFVESGRGAPLLFVHGSLDDLRSWRFQMAPFADRYRAVAYSRRYHHPNPWHGDGSDYTAELHAADLAGVIRGLGLAPVHLVTSSYGGNVALLLTVREPGLVRSLVLGEPPLLPWLELIPGGAAHRQAFLDDAWLPARRAFAAGCPEDGVRAFLDGVMGRPTFEHLSARTRAMILDNAPEMAAETLANRYFPPFSCDDARGMGCPVLLVSGELSPALFHLITDSLAACIPHSHKVTVSGASHAIHVGNPQAYNAAVLGFLARHEGV